MRAGVSAQHDSLLEAGCAEINSEWSLQTA
jgi:hypothetical protein